MTRTMRLLVGSMMIGLACIKCPALAATQDQAPSERVRPTNAAIALLIRHASERSHTFRGLIDTINASDGIVYIEQGKCGHSMRACLVRTMPGPNRMLWVKLDIRGTDCDLMGAIGHELRHAVEVLDDPKVTSASAMYLFYSQRANELSGKRPVETGAALEAGEAVRAEVRRKSHCTKVR